MSYSLNNAIEDACKNLPEGYEIHLIMERDAAYVELHSPNSCDIYSVDGADKILAEQVAEAIEKARGD